MRFHGKKYHIKKYKADLMVNLLTIQPPESYVKKDQLYVTDWKYACFFVFCFFCLRKITLGTGVGITMNINAPCDSIMITY